jgi:hypothetical protein
MNRSTVGVAVLIGLVACGGDAGSPPDLDSLAIQDTIWVGAPQVGPGAAAHPDSTQAVAADPATGTITGETLGHDTRSTAAGAAAGTAVGVGVAPMTRGGHSTLEADGGPPFAWTAIWSSERSRQPDELTERATSTLPSGLAPIRPPHQEFP